MLHWFDHVRIAVKVAVAPALAILGLVAISIGTYAVFAELRQDFEYLNDTAFTRFSDAARLQTAAAQAHALVYRITSLANANDMQQASAQTDAAKRALSDLIVRAKEQQIITGNARVSAAAEAYVKAANGALDMIDADPGMAILLMVGGHEQFEKFSSLLQEVATTADQGRALTFASAVKSIAGARFIFILSAVGAAILALVATVAVTRAISRPVGTLTRVMRSLAAGGRDIDVPYADRRDELGDMARAVQVFKQQAIEGERLAAERAAERAAKERRQAALAQQTQDFGGSISGVVASLGSSANDMRRAAKAMSDVADSVNAEAHGTAEGATKACKDLAAVAAAVEELTSTVAEISRQVTTSGDIARQAVQRADASHDIMQSLSQAAARIGDVVQLISEIASQTNLLALNATIEAARAGEAGKGFAVVAGEVKALAAQTAKATAEIGNHINTVRGAADNAVTVTNEISHVIRQIDEVLVAISAAVEEQNVTTRDIAASVQTVSGATAETARAMEHVVEVAESAGNMSRDVLDGAAGISREAETLRHEVDEFLGAIG